MNMPVRMLAVALVTVSGLSVSRAGEAPSFRYDVLPTLTRAGCNAGTCHGTPTGKKGFRLSLRGYDPPSDLASLTREVGGRRINLTDPPRSRILQKATAQIPHEGGRRLAVGDGGFETLCRWIAAGAPDDPPERPELVRLTIEPTSIVVDAPRESQSFRVTAHFEDGSAEEVTDRCRFSMTDDAVAELNVSGVIRKRKRGEVTVSAEFAGAMASATVLFREPVADFTWPDPPPNNRIDELVFARLQELQIEPAGLCDDATFLRRVCLDVNGRLPAPEEVRVFLADESAHKRERLIEQLLQRSEFADWWALKWADRLGCNQRFVGKAGAIKYHAWIRHAMAVNLPHDEFVRTILTANGPNYSEPAAGFWRRMRVGGIGAMDPLLAAEEVSQLFLGVRIQCARCHNHPGEKWTQDDYYGLAAFFPQIAFKDGPFVNHQYDKEVTVFPGGPADLVHPATARATPPRLLGDESERVLPDADRRQVFAEWVTSAHNPFFARAEVNRIWFHLFGRGIVEPVDDFRSSNPPTHPELLDWLAGQFVASGFDRQHIIRLILNSRTYQLDFRPTPTSQRDGRYFSYRPPRLLQAEQLLDAISQATGVPEAFPGVPPGTRAVQLSDGEYKHPFLEAFGRPARAIACECERESSTNMAQALHLTGGSMLHAKLTSNLGRCAQLAESDLSSAEIVEELCLATISRKPGDSERELMTHRLDAAGSDRRQAIEDILWALLNHREFLFQH